MQSHKADEMKKTATKLPSAVVLLVVMANIKKVKNKKMRETVKNITTMIK